MKGLVIANLISPLPVAEECLSICGYLMLGPAFRQLDISQPLVNTNCAKLKCEKFSTISQQGKLSAGKSGAGRGGADRFVGKLK